MTTITPTAARAELARRADNKTGTYVAPADTAAAKAAARKLAPELRAIASRKAPAKAGAVKTTQAEHIELADGRIAVIVAQVPATAKPAKVAKVARKTGVGSRGGDPRKAEAFQVALATGAKVWSPNFKLAYNAHLGTLVSA